MTVQDWALRRGPYSGYKVVDLTPKYSLAVPSPAIQSLPKPDPVSVVLSALPSLVLAWVLIWMRRLLPEDDLDA